MSFIHSEVVIEPHEDEEYCIIRWDVPYLATIKPGTLTIALSIADADNKNYLWQTIPARLTVQPNIGLRSAKGNVNIVATEAINERLLALENLFLGDTTIDLQNGGVA
jgi:hypothetical protein